MFTLGAKSRYTDTTVDRFQKTNLLHTRDKYELFQDPTSLGFKMLFEMNQPGCGLLCDSGPENSDLPNTAMNYLHNIGDEVRAGYLGRFTSHLRKINLNTPWFFQSIVGLGDAWKRRYNEDDFAALLPKERKLEITCLESIDMRMTALMDLYRKACFDFNFRREVVPWNLRTFTVYIYVYENRTINASGMPSPNLDVDVTSLLGIPDANATQQDQNYRFLNKEKPTASLMTGVNNLLGGLLGTNKIEKDDEINTKITHLMFKFTQCEFLPDESGDMLSTISNINGEMSAQKIVFSYRNVEEINLYTLYSDVNVRDALIGTLKLASNDVVYTQSANGIFVDSESTNQGGIMTMLKNKLGENLNKIVSVGADKLEAVLKSKVNKAILGNVFGFSAQSALQLGEDLLAGDPTKLFNMANNSAVNRYKRKNNKSIEQISSGMYGASLSNKTTDIKDRSINENTSVGASLSNKTKDVTEIR